MNVNSLRRIITFILLLLALSILTGGAQTASALMNVETAAPCCPHESNSGEAPFDLPDCNQDCNCSNCQGVDISYRLLLLNPSLEALLKPPVLLTTFPPGHQQAIDYPPETV